MTNDERDQTDALHARAEVAEGTAPFPDELPILPLRDAVLFPQAIAPLAVARPASVRVVDEAVRGGRLIGVIAQRDASQEEPAAHELHGVGTVAVIHKMLKQADGTIRLILQGLERFRPVAFTESSPYFKARIDRLPDVPPAADDLEAEALGRQLLALFQKIVELSPMLDGDLVALVAGAGDPGRAADVIAATLAVAAGRDSSRRCWRPPTSRLASRRW